MKRLRFLALLPMIAAAGCEELRTPQSGLSPVLATAPASGGPLRAAVDATAAAFTNQGLGLEGRPAEAALAFARFEALDLEVSNRRAWPQISPSIPIAMRTALRENRAALGVAQSAPGPEVIRALGTAAARLRAEDRAGAAAALAPGLFEPGGEATLDRLGAPGPLPAAEQSSAALAREVRRLDLDAGWAGAGAWWQSGAPGAITDGLGTGF